MTIPVLPRIGRHVITTNQIEEFVNIAALWIRQSVPGGLVYGRQRIGKSTAVELFVSLFQRLFNGTVGCVSATVEPASVASPKQFWGELLKSMKLPVPTSKAAEVRRDWFVGRIIEAAASTSLNKVAIIIDEASLLTEANWLWLFGVDNTIRGTYGIDATWIFVGQPELQNMPTLMLGLGRREVVGRFMSDRYEFREMSSLDDFSRAVAAFDTLKDSVDGRVLSERAHPEKFAKGWRFQGDAELIYESVQIARTKANLAARDGMTMQGFVRLTSHLIAETIPQLATDEVLNAQHMFDAIAATNCMLFEQHAEFLQSASVPAR